jgi:hypothetical protein
MLYTTCLQWLTAGRPACLRFLQLFIVYYSLEISSKITESGYHHLIWGFPMPVGFASPIGKATQGMYPLSVTTSR